MVRITRMEEPVARAAQIAEVYRSAFSVFPDRPADEEVRTFAHETLARHANREAFCFLAALEDDELVGFIYGYHGARGEWWEDWVHERLPADIYDEWFTNQFDVTEFCVRADRHGQGIGSRLYDTLFAEIADAPYDRAVLTTRRAGNPARDFYMRRGWEIVWDGLDRRFALLGLHLR